MQEFTETQLAELRSKLNAAKQARDSANARKTGAKDALDDAVARKAGIDAEREALYQKQKMQSQFDTQVSWFKRSNTCKLLYTHLNCLKSTLRVNLSLCTL